MDVFSPMEIFRSDSQIKYMCCQGNGYCIIEEKSYRKNIRFIDNSNNFIGKQEINGRILKMGNIAETRSIYLLMGRKIGERSIMILNSESNDVWHVKFRSIYSIQQNPLTTSKKLTFHESEKRKIHLITFGSNDNILSHTIPWQHDRLFWPMPTKNDAVDIFSPNWGFSYSTNGIFFKIDLDGKIIHQQPIQFYKIFPLKSYDAIITIGDLIKFKTILNVIDDCGNVIKTMDIPHIEPYSFSNSNDNNYLLINTVSIINKSRMYLISSNFSIKSFQLDRFIHQAVFLPLSNKIIMHNFKSIFELKLPC